MVRKYDIKNKRYFIIVASIFLVLISIFSFFVYRYLTIEKSIYYANSGSYLLDSNNNSLLLSSDAEIVKKWTGNYLVMYGDNNKKFYDNLIVYNNNSLKLYGKFYQVLLDGKVSILDDESVISDTSDSSFFKLDDRKYLVVSSNIQSSDDSIIGNNFLYVHLDKQGNALLVNDTLNLKTIEKTTLITDAYSFDIASETLTIGDKVIDLKKIIGSSNLYKDDDNDNDNTSENNKIDDNNSNTLNSTTNSEVLVNNKSEESKSIVKNSVNSMSTSVLGINASYTRISCNYVVYDPSNTFTSIYVDIYNDNGTFLKKINLSRDGSIGVIDNLDYDTNYKLLFRYTYINDNNEEEVKTFYEQSVKTKNASFSLKVNKISTLSSVISYDIILDESFLEEVILSDSIISFNISLEIDDFTDIDTISYNLSASDDFNSLRGEFSLPNLNTNDIITLRLNSFSLDNKINYVDNVIYQFKNI